MPGLALVGQARIGRSALATWRGRGETALVRYTKITTDRRGGARFEEVEVPQASTPFAENVPPVLVSAAMAATSVVFVTTPSDVRETQPHTAPQRQFGVVLEGAVEIETSDGDKRTFTPGVVALVED